MNINKTKKTFSMQNQSCGYDPCDPCGPCGPVCPAPASPCAVCPEVKKAYAYYSQHGRLYNSALFGAIQLDNEPVQTSQFIYDAGVIHILKSGVYLVAYIVNFPENASVSTTLMLQANNQTAPETVRVIEKTGDGVPYTAVVQTVLKVDTTVSLRLSSAKVLNVSAAAEDTVASLSIIEL